MSPTTRPTARPTARNAVAFSFAAKYAMLGLRLASLLLLVRLLPPEEFGVFAVAGAVVSLIFVFGEFGLHSYLIQVPRLTRAVVAGAVGLCTALTGAAFAAVLLLVFGFPGLLPGPEAAPVLLLLAAATAVQPIGLPVAAKLQRDMRFDRLLVIDLARTVVSVSLGIGLVLAGWGIIGLAWGAIADAVVGTGLSLAFAARRRLVRPSIRGWGPMLRFGLPFAMVDGLGRGSEAGVALLLGRTAGYGAAGLYDRALTVTKLLDKAFVQALAPVVLPVLSREVRGGGDLRRPYLRKVGALTAIYWPFFAVLALLAEPAVALLLGPQWAAAAPIVRALAVAELFAPFTALSAKFFNALDANAAYLRIQAVAVAVRLAAVALLAPISLEAAALGLALAAMLRMVIITLWLERRLRVPWSALGAHVARGAAIAAFAASGPATVLLVVGAPAGIGAGLLAAALAGAGWVAGLAVTRHPLGRDLLDVLYAAGRRLRLPNAARNPATWRPTWRQ